MRPLPAFGRLLRNILILGASVAVPVVLIVVFVVITIAAVRPAARLTAVRPHRRGHVRDGDHGRGRSAQTRVGLPLHAHVQALLQTKAATPQPIGQAGHHTALDGALDDAPVLAAAALRGHLCALELLLDAHGALQEVAAAGARVHAIVVALALLGLAHLAQASRVRPGLVGWCCVLAVMLGCGVAHAARIAI